MMWHEQNGSVAWQEEKRRRGAVNQRRTGCARIAADKRSSHGKIIMANNYQRTSECSNIRSRGRKSLRWRGFCRGGETLHPPHTHGFNWTSPNNLKETKVLKFQVRQHSEGKKKQSVVGAQWPTRNDLWAYDHLIKDLRLKLEVRGSARPALNLPYWVPSDERFLYSILLLFEMDLPAIFTILHRQPIQWVKVKVKLPYFVHSKTCQRQDLGSRGGKKICFLSFFF